MWREFRKGNMNESIAEIDEGDLVDRLRQGPFGCTDLVRLPGIPGDVVPLTRVCLSGLGIEGDVDVLLYSPAQPRIATAIEVKKIKIGARAFRNGSPNKLGQLSEAVRQANKLANAGFSQVYLYVFVVVDSRKYSTEKDEGEAGSKLKSVVRESIRREQTRLQKEIGVYQYDLVQWEDEHPLLIGGRAATLHRLAAQTPQRQNVTDWVKQQFARSPQPLASLYHEAFRR
jgi:hypothetical protein